MKICPKCQQTYSDENLNFCLNDGSVLVQAGNVDSIPETVFISQPRPTTSNRQFGNQPEPVGFQPQNQWNNPQQFSMQPKASGSNGWLWTAGILGVLALLCGGGGLVGFLVFQTSEPDRDTNIYVSPKPADSPAAAKNVKKIDFSDWKTGTDEFATADYDGGIFTLETIKNDFYYVIVATKENKTQNATTKVTVKNVDASPVTYGFGLIVHSYVTPLVGDYAFLIDSEKKRYRIVKHSLKKQATVQDWKSFKQIKSGTSENVLEARDKGAKIEFYINGEYAATINDDKNNADGVAGIYASDGIPVAFSDLQIEK